MGLGAEDRVVEHPTRAEIIVAFLWGATLAPAFDAPFLCVLVGGGLAPKGAMLALSIDAFWIGVIALWSITENIGKERDVREARIHVFDVRRRGEAIVLSLFTIVHVIAALPLVATAVRVWL